MTAPQKWGIAGLVLLGLIALCLIFGNAAVVGLFAAGTIVIAAAKRRG